MPSKSDFQKHIGTTFKITLENGNEVSLILKDANERLKPPIYAFFLTFESDSSFILNGNTYTLNHLYLNDFDCFLSPYKKENNKVYYQTIFSKVLS